MSTESRAPVDTTQGALSDSRRALTVNEIIDERPVSRFQATTILLCGLVLLLDGFDTQAMGFLVPPIAEELGLPLSAFGTVLSAGLFGLMLGAMGSGPIADRWGRKGAIIVSAFVFGGFSLATARADTLGELELLRFLTGLGLGGAMPNVVSLASEYAPKRLQPILVTAASAVLFRLALGDADAGHAHGWVLGRQRQRDRVLARPHADNGDRAPRMFAVHRGQRSRQRFAGVRIVAAIDPKFAADGADDGAQGPARQRLEARGPARPLHASAERGHVQLAPVQQRRAGEAWR